jgi:Cu-Zn family superoxide dismutase
MRRYSSIAFLIALTACARTLEEAGGDVMLRDHAADVVMRSPTGNLLGTLRLAHTPSGSARLVGTLTGIPAGKHGIHVHAVGVCNGPSFESAGGHFNPMSRQHGLENPNGSHAGDAPNIVADTTLQSLVDITFALATLATGTDNGLFDANGSAIVIHADADDQKTDPSGNSGARIACGVVTKK